MFWKRIRSRRSIYISLPALKKMTQKSNKIGWIKKWMTISGNSYHICQIICGPIRSVLVSNCTYSSLSYFSVSATTGITTSSPDSTSSATDISTSPTDIMSAATSNRTSAARLSAGAAAGLAVGIMLLVLLVVVGVLLSWCVWYHETVG